MDEESGVYLENVCNHNRSGSVLGFGAAGCGVKRTITVAVPAKIRTAKTATFGDLLAMLAWYSEQLSSLSSTTMRVTFVSGRAETGTLQAYRSAPGYILLKRPDLIRLNIQNPLTKTSIVELLSRGDTFSIWYPRDNKVYIGRNSARELVFGETTGITARPAHIFEAILPQKVDLKQPGARVSFEEEAGATTLFYVLSVFREEEGNRLVPVRRVWVDRADLTVSKQVIFQPDGRVAGVIDYSNLTVIDSLSLPLSIRILRPLDGYSMDLQFKDWKVNPSLPEEAFNLNPPATAERVVLKEKGTGVNP